MYYRDEIKEKLNMKEMVLTEEEKDKIRKNLRGWENIFEAFSSYENEIKIDLYELVEFTNSLRDKGVTDIKSLQLSYNEEDGDFELEGRVYINTEKEFRNACIEVLAGKKQRYKEYLKMQDEFEEDK